MYPISEEDFVKYYKQCDNFNWVDVPECGAVLFYRYTPQGNELVAIADRDKYYAKYLYWIVQNTEQSFKAKVGCTDDRCVF